MKYQIGDDIIVLHSNEEGKVVELMNDKMVMIEVRGVKFPAYMDQIDFPYFYRFSKKKIIEEEKKKVPKVFIDQIPKEKTQPNQIKIANGVWLAFIPKFFLDDFNDEVVELLKVYLINRTNISFQFNYKQEFLHAINFELNSLAIPFHDFYLHDIPFANVNDSPSFHFDFSLTTPQKNKALHFETSIKIKPKQIFKRVEELKENNEAAINYLLFETYPDKLVEEKFELERLAEKGFKVYDLAAIKQNLAPARELIDLHIEKLMDKWQHLSNLEIIGIQLQEFEKWYELATAHRKQHFIVIHGVGTGKLKDEIHELLKTRKEVKYFINQYNPRFGYGATEIFFQY
jgi:hypothetical protein